MSMDHHGPGAVGDHAHAALSHLQADFPGFRIWEEAIAGRTRYVAVRRSLSAGLHTLVTADPGELRAELDLSEQPPAVMAALDRAADPGGQAGGGPSPGERRMTAVAPVAGVVPPGIDVRVPSPARMYDFYLGGKDNFPADREAARKALSVVPQGRAVAWANRRFMVRAVKYLARHGVRQFIDLGTGIPTSPNVHEAARAVVPGTAVVYVDHDPIVTVHSRALLATQAGIAAIGGDIRDPHGILANDELREVIDFSQPVGLLFVAVLHFISGEENPAAIVAAFADAVPAGSHLVISHITSDGTGPHVVATIEEAYRNASAAAVFRTRDQIADLFSGFDLVPPGLTEVSEWRRSGRPAASPPALRFLGGAGIKR